MRRSDLPLSNVLRYACSKILRPNIPCRKFSDERLPTETSATLLLPDNCSPLPQAVWLRGNAYKLRVCHSKILDIFSNIITLKHKHRFLASIAYTLQIYKSTSISERYLEWPSQILDNSLDHT